MGLSLPSWTWGSCQLPSTSYREVDKESFLLTQSVCMKVSLFFVFRYLCAAFGRISWCVNGWSSRHTWSCPAKSSWVKKFLFACQAVIQILWTCRNGPVSQQRSDIFEIYWQEDKKLEIWKERLSKKESIPCREPFWNRPPLREKEETRPSCKVFKLKFSFVPTSKRSFLC